MEYRIVVSRDDNGTYLITSPDFPEVTTFAETESDIPRRAEDAVQTAIMGRISKRDVVPAPAVKKVRGNAVALSLLAGAKVALYREMRSQGKKKADMARALKVHAPQVDRLFDLRQKTQIEQVENGFAALGKKLTLAVGDVA